MTAVARPVERYNSAVTGLSTNHAAANNATTRNAARAIREFIIPAL
jgi:hypothetical protein